MVLGPKLHGPPVVALPAIPPEPAFFAFSIVLLLARNLLLLFPWWGNNRELVLSVLGIPIGSVSRLLQKFGSQIIGTIQFLLEVVKFRLIWFSSDSNKEK